MSKRKTILIVLTAIILTVVGAATFVIFKNINEKPPIVVEQNTSTSSNTVPAVSPVLHKTSFVGVDTIHWAKGSAKVTNTQEGLKVSFGADFEVAQGPDLYVYLSPNNAGQELGEYASLGSLKSDSGAQEYTLPENYKDYKTLVIWCRAFGVVFATADLS